MLLLFACCLCPAYGGYEYADRVISSGQYEYFFEWLNGILVVDGGGADIVEACNSSSVEVWSTSVPLGLDVGGIMDLGVTDNARLDYYGGETEELSLFKKAEAYLYGGRVDFISSHQFVTRIAGEPTGQHIHIRASKRLGVEVRERQDKGRRGSSLRPRHPVRHPLHDPL